LQSGDATLLDTGNPAVFALLRRSGNQTILIVANLGSASIADYKLDLSENNLSDGSAVPFTMFGAGDAELLEVTGGKFSGYKPLAELPPYQTYVFGIK